MRLPINPFFIRLGIVCCFIGIFIAGMMRGWIIIQLPTSLTKHQQTTSIEERSCSFWLSTAQGFRNEKETCLWPHDTAAALQSLVTVWTNLTNEDAPGGKTLHLQTALMSDGHTAYLSFEQSLFDSEQSTHARWHKVESLLRTIRENMPEITSVMFLVNHKPLIDRCLDFSRPWPIQGFLDN